jgi:hypothetical protein
LGGVWKDALGDGPNESGLTLHIVYLINPAARASSLVIQQPGSP